MDYKSDKAVGLQMELLNWDSLFVVEFVALNTISLFDLQETWSG